MTRVLYSGLGEVGPDGPAEHRVHERVGEDEDDEAREEDLEERHADAPLRQREEAFSPAHTRARARTRKTGGACVPADARVCACVRNA